MVLIKEYPDGLVVRSAETGDKEAIAQIDAFAELDYVRAVYDHYMENPNYHLFVGEIHGLVIAFCFVCIADEGETAIRGAKRVHQDYRGKGFLSKFIDPVEDYVSAQFPGVKQWRYAAANDDYQKKQMPVYKEAGVLLKLVIRNDFLTTARVTDLKAPANQEKVRKLSKEYAVLDIVQAETGKIPDCLLKPSVQAELFPQETVVVFWEPHRANRSSLQWIVDRSECYITYFGGGQAKVKAVSFIVDIVTKKSTLRYDTEIYINDTLSADERNNCVKQHLVHAYLRLRSKYQSVSRVVFHVFIPNDIPVYGIKRWIVENLPGISEYRLDHIEDEYIVCEYDRERWAQLQRNKTR